MRKKRIQKPRPCAVCGDVFQPTGTWITCSSECSAIRKKQKDDAYHAGWRARNPDKWNAWGRRWRTNNPERFRQLVRNWQARQKARAQQ